MHFVVKQENLRGTGRLYALVHISVPRSDAQLRLRFHFVVWGPFMQTDGLICVLHEKKKQESLRGTCRLHALVHVFVSRSDAQAKLDDSISR